MGVPVMRVGLRALVISIALSGTNGVHAANHLDTPTVIADPRADIGDIFAWVSKDGKRLNLVMTIVGHSFSDELRYVFHVDSGERFGRTSATTSIVCRFTSMKIADCQVGEADRAVGDPGRPEGLVGRSGRFRVFAGLRDDPFFNNVKGSRDAYQVAAAALHTGTELDAANCARLDAKTSRTILDTWRHTDGGSGQNFLAGWTPAAIVIAIDLDVVTTAGKMLAVWGVTATSSGQVDRMGRPLTENALLATLGPADVANALKERFNATTPADSAQFVNEIEKGLALYDGFDGHCGNQLLSDRSAKSIARYRRLAQTLADDRLWINSDFSKCVQFFAVELATLAGRREFSRDCGGRAPSQDAIDVYRSLLVNGSVRGVDDGVDRDEVEHSSEIFPFLAPVQPTSIDGKP